MKTHWLSCPAAFFLASCVHAFAAGDSLLPAWPQIVEPGGQATAPTSSHALQGLFCNASEQIDQAIGHMREGLSPRSAVAFVNREAVVCTFVDLLRYVVDHPALIKEMPGSFRLFLYEGTLVAVIVGSAVRHVTPPVRVYFAIPEKLAVPLAGRV